MKDKVEKVKKVKNVPALAPPAPVVIPETPAAPRALVLGDVISDLPQGYAEPVFLVPFRDALRSVAALPSKTREERAAVRDAVVAFLDAALPGHGIPPGRHTGRWSGQPVFESQNAIYLAAVLANVPIAEGTIMAFWRAELPNAKCDYLIRNYAWTTLSEYLHGRHNGSVVPGAHAAVAAWAARHRQPLAQ